MTVETTKLAICWIASLVEFLGGIMCGYNRYSWQDS